MVKPRQCHLDAAMRILEYIKKSLDKELLFKKNDHLRLEAYSNVNYVGDRGDRKSTSSFCTFLGGNGEVRSKPWWLDLVLNLNTKA